eukprot:7954926-Pyramimonas_sp.AAC.1
MRRVSKSFPAGTSASQGNFHPRHAATIDEDGLEVSLPIWEDFEAIGVPPKQLRWIQMSLSG